MLLTGKMMTGKMVGYKSQETRNKRLRISHPTDTHGANTMDLADMQT